MNAEKAIKKIIFSFLDLKRHRIFIFGSRATGKARKFSDYDIGIIGKKPVPWRLMAQAKASLEESRLPYRVDLIDFSLVSSGFRRAALLKIRSLR